MLIALGALTRGHCGHSSLPDKGHFVSHLRFVYMLILTNEGIDTDSLLCYTFNELHWLKIITW